MAGLVKHHITYNGFESDPEITHPLSESELVKIAFTEASDARFVGKTLQGPHYQDFATVLTGIDAQLAAIHPDLTAEHLKPISYRNRESTIELQSDSKFARYAVNVLGLRYDKQSKLEDLGQRLGTLALNNPLSAVQSIDTTPYHYQGDGSRWACNPQRTCFNACFRMVFDGITNHSLEEDTVQNAIREVYSETIISDEEYLKVFNTNIFQEFFGKRVQILTITGANLPVIDQIGTKFRQKSGASKIFAIASLGSESREPGVWHTNVLIRAGKKTVTVHDPSLHKDRRSPDRKIIKADFHRRWALALNRVHMFIVHDTQTA